jgi:hypothetical protein
MIDLVGEIASAIASGAGGAFGAKGAETVEHLISALREKLRGNPAARGALEISIENPADMAAGGRFLALLRDHTAKDAEFRAWLADTWSEVRPALEADASHSANLISGTVHGHVVQARDVHGGIHLGPADQGPPARLLTVYFRAGDSIGHADALAAIGLVSARPLDHAGRGCAFGRHPGQDTRYGKVKPLCRDPPATARGTRCVRDP